MALLEILKDQSAFGFTGKINALLKSNGQFFGVVYQSEGYIVDAKVQNISGKKGLLNLIFIDVEKDDYLKFVVEPEVLNHENFTMKLSKKFAHYLSSKKLKPPGNLKLLIDPEIIVNNDQITPEEFDVLALLSEWCLVSDIYKYSKLMDYEVTDALVTLRKKKAIKVFQN